MNVTIIGGGIAGLTTAIALKKAGFTTTIFEAAPNVMPVGAGLVLAANAIRAFQKINIADEVISKGNIIPYFTIYNQQGDVLMLSDSEVLRKKYGINNFTIHRADLHDLLLSKIDKDTIHFGKRAVDFIYGHDGVTIRFEDGSRSVAESVIIADGINSPIRNVLLPGSTPRYAGYTCWRAVVENTRMKITETSETWGTKGRFGIAPLPGNKVYWFACINAPQNDAGMKAFKIKDLQEQFAEYHQPIANLLQETNDEVLIWNDILDLDPIYKYAFGNMLLIGDAAHATTPNLGQGACQAIEDAVILADELKKNTSVEIAFKAFEQRRLKRTHYIIKTSRSIGRIAQLENSMLTSIRNTFFRMLPQAVTDRQLEMLYKVDL